MVTAKHKAILFLVLSVGAVVGCSSGGERVSGGTTAIDPAATSLSREVVGEAIAGVLEPLARRSLTPAEIDAVTGEYIPLFGENDCTELCVESIRFNAQRIAPVIDTPGTPADVRVRHEYISQLYFSPEQGGSLIQLLSAEADPILVVDGATSRLMTRADVIGAMHLRALADSGEPQPVSFTEEQINSTAQVLREVYGPGTLNGPMPFRLTWAGTLWAGVDQGWPTFTQQERDQIRIYFSDSSDARPLSAELYTDLLSVTAAEGEQIALDELSAYYSASLLDIALQGALFQLDLITISSYFGPYVGY